MSRAEAQETPLEYIQYEVKDKIAIISLDRPEARNAQNRQFLDELDACWTKAAEDEEVVVIVLRANGKHFSAGHDMSAKPGDGGAELDFQTKGLAAIFEFERVHYIGYSEKWRNVPKPSIAAVQGACIAAGLMLCWPCDLIVASEDAFFSDPVLRMGIGGVEYHAHTWEFGARKAKELLFTADRITAEEAEKLGMVNKVVPRERLDEATMELAARIAEMNPFALSQAKRMVNSTLDIMGQHNALHAAFNIHTTGHGHAMSLTGWPALVDLEAMKKAQKGG
jgi:enoyl-CoA hydratase/carnithine racemase